jgi:hypothetical protein
MFWRLKMLWGWSSQAGTLMRWIGEFIEEPQVEEWPRFDREPISVRLQLNDHGYFSSTVMSLYFEI